MSGHLSLEQRLFVYNSHIRNGGIYRLIRLEYQRKFPGKTVTARTVRKIFQKMNTQHTLHDAPRTGRPKTSMSEPTMRRVEEAFREDPELSLREAVSELNLSYGSIWRILKQLKFKPYKPRSVQALKPEDLEKRRQFCTWFLEEYERDPDFLNRILWTDEAAFKTKERRNRQNHRHWSDHNPHVTAPAPLEKSSLMVWAGIQTTGVEGPYVFEGNVTGDSYRQLLEQEVLPSLEDQVEDLDTLLWQQDGAPPHFANEVRNLLDEKFEQWIGRGGPIPWPPRSPDLTPLDYSVWGIVKETVRKDGPENDDELLAMVESALAKLNNNPDLCERICESMVKRCRLCLEMGGGHFEQLL